MLILDMHFKVVVIPEHQIVAAVPIVIAYVDPRVQLN